MNLLLDTQAMLWFVSGDAKLSEKARQLIQEDDTVNYISIASWWETAIKCSLGKLRLDIPLAEFIEQRIAEGFRVLSIEPQHLPRLVSLPFHHRDPFDRLIISQAISEDMPLCTSDSRFASYGVPVIW